MNRLALPSKVLKSSFSDDQQFVEACYSYFKEDFVNSHPTFRATPMGLKRLPIRDGKEATFYHMTTEGMDEKNRTLEPCRSERIRWAKPVIENEIHSDLRVWSERRGSENRIHLWLHSRDYVVVVSERRGYYVPWTAFCVNYTNYRQKLDRRWRRYR